METIQIKSTDEATQGPFVIINKDDFDDSKHDLFDAPKSLTVAELREALTAKGIEFDHGAKKADLQALLDA